MCGTGWRGWAKQDMDPALSITAHWEVGSGGSTLDISLTTPSFLQMECNEISI